MMDHIEGDHANHHTTGVVTGSDVCCIFFLNMLSEEHTSNNIQMVSGQIGTWAFQHLSK